MRRIKEKEKIIRIIIISNIIINIITFNNTTYIGGESIIRKIEEIFLIVIDIIGYQVIKYSNKYMKEDEKRELLIIYIFVFLGVMKLVVILDNFYKIYYVWELLGLISYFFIRFWNSSLNNNLSAFKAILLNRIGDIGFLYIIIKEEIEIKGSENISLIGIKKEINIYLLFMLFIKSAQWLGFPWLINAMAAPTPISSLLHSATMVSSGIYLSMKYNIPINRIEIKIWLILGVLIGIGKRDIKKIIAISTTNNISLMFLSKSSIGYIHMINHGIMKSIIFIISGNIIHLISSQDYRKLRGSLYIDPYIFKLFLGIFIPLPYICMTITKEIIIISTGIKNYILVLIFTYFYTSYSKRFYTYFLNTPTFSYYIKKSSSYNINIYFIGGFLISLFLNSFINTIKFSYLDLLPFSFLFISTFNLNINLMKHIENLLYSFLSSSLLFLYNSYFLHLDKGFFSFNLIRIK